MKSSLSHRLVLILLLLTLCIWVSVAAVIWMLGIRAIEREIDNQLRTLVSTVSYTIDAFITAGYRGAPEVSLLDFEVITSGVDSVYTVEIPDATVSMSLNVWSSNTLRGMTQGSPLFEPPHTAGIRDEVLPDGSAWRVIRSRLGDTDLWLVAGLNKAQLDAESTRLLFALLSPLLAGLLVVVPLTYYAVRNGLKPLRDLEHQIRQRSSYDLHSVETQDIPVEVAPVVAALNRLLAQLGATLEKEKRITADAAHELQTPLAAIKTEAQIALSHSHGLDKATLSGIIDRVNRASHAVTQLTALSRLESSSGAFTHTVDLYELTEQVCDSYSKKLSERDLTINVSGRRMTVSGNADMLRILVDNLVRNAVNYAREGSVVSIALVDGRACEFVIENESHPISEQEWRLITQRFYRVPGSHGHGTGLGMSIAQRICELHGATFAVGKRESGDGFSVTVEFPRSAGEGAD